ncbi:MAG: 4Fe-4S binding protein [Microthrixaceae bacterium]
MPSTRPSTPNSPVRIRPTRWCSSSTTTCTRCALCVDRCPTGVIILGKIGAPAAGGDQHQRTNTHGYGYGMRLG